ncbi:Msa family membrane protein [Streptococcus sp. DD12]|uniref:Msa family membrane protein n=1 Tax=Streptococcus sp. DD12 TaxID=1777880 RepID=UPI000836AF99|nr:Msa family membrane protein [Streptococcus sp. DD12]
MIYLITAILINVILVFVATIFLDSMSILGFISIIYFFPIIMNITLSALAIDKGGKKGNYCYSFPSMSLIMYLIIGVLLYHSQSWINFIENNVISSGEMYIRVNSNLLDLSQIIFVALLYFLVEFLCLKLIERRNKYENN